MNLKVVKHEADEEKGSFKVLLKGEATDLVDGCVIAVELKLKGKREDLIEQFPRNCKFKVSMDAEV